MVELTLSDLDMNDPSSTPEGNAAASSTAAAAARVTDREAIDRSVGEAAVESSFTSMLLAVVMPLLVERCTCACTGRRRCSGCSSASSPSDSVSVSSVVTPAAAAAAAPALNCCATARFCSCSCSRWRCAVDLGAGIAAPIIDSEAAVLLLLALSAVSSGRAESSGSVHGRHAEEDADGNASASLL